MNARMRRQRGFSIIEFMIAATLSLITLVALTTAFVSSSRTRDELDRASQQIENGRYSNQVLNDDLELAGYMAQLNPYCGSCQGLNYYYTAVTNPMTGTKLPDPCSTAVSDLKQAFAFHVEGIDNVATASAPACLPDIQAGSDVLVVRRVSTCVAGTPNCSLVAGAPYFQASLCNNGTELLSNDPNDWYALDTNTANLTKRKRDCSTIAEMRRFLVHIYYVAKDDQGSDGIPTLKRAELDRGAGNCATRDASGNFCIVSIAEGVEQFQLEYGIDYTFDGQPDAFSANPSAYTAPATQPGATCPTTLDDCVNNWLNVVSVKVNLLVRATTKAKAGAIPTATLTKTYTLGLKADGTANTFTPGADGYKRHVFQSSVWLNNPAGRRAS